MPKKTRKEKYAAKLHKYRIQQHKSDTSSALTEGPKADIKFSSVHATPSQTSKKGVTFDDQTRIYFIEDLKKSAVVISSIFILELALYFSTQTGLLHFIHY